MGTVFLVVGGALWLLALLATLGTWSGVRKGDRPRSDMRGALVGLSACTASFFGVTVALTANGLL